MIIGAILTVSLLLLLPQLAGLALMRFVRSASSSWVAWPAAAISVFGLVFYWWLWVPACDAAERSQSHCGWSLALGFGLLLGLFVHLAVGVLLGLLARRAPQRDGTARLQKR